MSPTAIASSFAATSAQTLSNQLATTFVKQQAKQDQSLAAMIADAAQQGAAATRAAPPPGQGTRLDVLA